MKYIKMQEEHVQQVAQLEKCCFSSPWSERSIRGELTNPLSLWLVAVDGDTVAGYIGSQSVMGEADMMNVATAPSYRKQGIGENLVCMLISELKANGIYSLTLEVRASNTAAISLYHKFAFVQVGRRPNYYSAPREDALILRKEWQCEDFGN